MGHPLMMISSRRRDRERTKFTGASYLGSRLSCYEVKQLVCNWRDKTEDLVCVHFLCCYCCYIASVVSNSVRLHRRQPTRLPRPWDSPGKNTGVGCHFLLQCTKVKSESEVAQSYLTLSDPMDCSLPGSSVYGIFQARVLECVAIALSNQIRLDQSLSHVRLFATP